MHYVLGLSVRLFVRPERSCYHDISWMVWVFSMTLIQWIFNSPVDDLIKFWRSKVKVVAGRRGNEGFHVDDCRRSSSSYQRDAMLARYMMSVRHMMVSYFATPALYQMAKCRITQTRSHDSPGTLVSWRKKFYEISMKSPPPNTVWVGKIAFYDRLRSRQCRRLTAKNVFSSATVVRVHDGALVEEYHKQLWW